MEVNLGRVVGSKIRNGDKEPKDFIKEDFIGWLNGDIYILNDPEKNIPYYEYINGELIQKGNLRGPVGPIGPQGIPGTGLVDLGETEEDPHNENHSILDNIENSGTYILRYINQDGEIVPYFIIMNRQKEFNLFGTKTEQFTQNIIYLDNNLLSNQYRDPELYLHSFSRSLRGWFSGSTSSTDIEKHISSEIDLGPRYLHKVKLTHGSDCEIYLTFIRSSKTAINAKTKEELPFTRNSDLISFNGFFKKEVNNNIVKNVIYKIDINGLNLELNDGDYIIEDYITNLDIVYGPHGEPYPIFKI